MTTAAHGADPGPLRFFIGAAVAAVVTGSIAEGVFDSAVAGSGHCEASLTGGRFCVSGFGTFGSVGFSAAFAVVVCSTGFLSSSIVVFVVVVVFVTVVVFASSLSLPTEGVGSAEFAATAAAAVVGVAAGALIHGFTLKKD